MKIYLAFVGLLLIFTSCKKEPTTWQTDWVAPIAHGHLTLSDVLPVENLQSDSLNNLSIVFHEAVYTFNIDTLVDLPDTTILKKSAVGVSSLTVNPGFSYTDTYDQEYVLDQIELKKVRIQSGIINVLVSCPWQGASVVKFSFPEITLAGIPFERTYSLPAASLANPATATETINLAGYLMDLTGTSGNLINYLGAVFQMGSNEAVTTFTVSDMDSISYQIEFQNLVPDYAKGYFGQYHFEDTVGISLPFMKNITAGNLDIDSISLVLTVKNGFNLIAQSKITDIKGLNTNTAGIVDLSFPLDNTSMNINPASGGIYNHTSSTYPIVINDDNSNITNFIENLNDSILLGYELDINPFGNVTGGSDEIFPGSVFELYLDAEFPLQFGSSGISLVDTFEFSYDNPADFTPENAVFQLLYSNGFPLEATANVIIQDENHTSLDTLQAAQIINAGAYNTTTFLTTPYSGELIVDLTSDNIANLDLAKYMILHISFATDQDQYIKINSGAYFDFVLKSNLKVNIEL